MEYKIISAHNQTKLLEERVNRALLEGWTCLGGVCISDESNFYQAMVRNK